MTKKRQVMELILLLKCVYKTEQTDEKPNKAFGKKYIVFFFNRLRRTHALILSQSILSLDNMN